MGKLRKILICPYFGELPEWFDKFSVPDGYDIILDRDLEGFKKRVKAKLGIDYPGLPGTGKVWDYRGSLGFLYQEEIKDYDYWGHCDWDVVFGDMNKWLPDKLLCNFDVFSGHDSYVNGCFSLYKNTQEVRELFFKCDDWKENMIHPNPNGWIEGSYSRILESSELKYLYTFWQGNPWCKILNLKQEDKKLYQDEIEIAFFHFRHFKYWPL